MVLIALQLQSVETLYTYFKKRCRGERRLRDRNELWVPFGMQNFTSCVAPARKWIHQL